MNTCKEQQRNDGLEKKKSCHVSWWTTAPTNHDDDHRASLPLDSSNHSIPEPFAVEYFVSDTSAVARTPQQKQQQPSVELIHLWKQYCRQKQKPPSLLQPTLIQLQSWSILQQQQQKVSLLQLAPVGSGKTLAYGVPLLLLQRQQRQQHNALVLVPTRELALQVSKECSRLNQSTKNRRVSIVACYGGINKQVQFKALLEAKSTSSSSSSSGLIIVATPGRCLDLLSSSKTITNNGTTVSVDSRQDDFQQWFVTNCRTIVLDEADRLAMQTDLQQTTLQILNLFVEQQIILCSATWPQKATATWNVWLKQKPCIVVKVDAFGMEATTPTTVSRNNSKNTSTANTPPCDTKQSNNKDHATSTAASTHSTTNIKNSTTTATDWMARIPSHLQQIVHVCAQHKKPRKLMHSLQNWFQQQQQQQQQDKRRTYRIVIFMAKITTVQYIYKMLQKEQQQQHKKKTSSNCIPPCTMLHGQMPQHAREGALQDFVAGKYSILLATDVAARGIHVDEIQLVINYDFPSNLEQYIHRCGRAGRGMTTMRTVQVLSFFTRTLAPMANDLVALLRSTNQWIDPNLSALLLPTAGRGEQQEDKVQLQKRKSQKDTNRNKKQRSSKSTNDGAVLGSAVGANSNNCEDDDNADEKTLDALYSANRIVLTRASNVSDASSSEEEDDNNTQN